MEGEGPSAWSQGLWGDRGPGRGAPPLPHREPLSMKAIHTSILTGSVYITSLLADGGKPLALPLECNSPGLEINKFLALDLRVSLEM